MKSNILLLLSASLLSLAFSGCGGSSGNSSTTTPATTVAKPFNAAGTWRGTVNSSISGANAATLRLKQYSSNNTALTGTYSTSDDAGSVPITGIIHDKTASFTIKKTGPGCSGSYKATGVVTDFGNGVKTIGYSSSVASNPDCVGNEIVVGVLAFASYSGPK